MDHISGDIIKLIADYFNAAEYAIFSRVCKRFRGIFVEMIKAGGICFAKYAPVRNFWIVRRSIFNPTREITNLSLLIFSHEKKKVEKMIKFVKKHNNDCYIHYH